MNDRDSERHRDSGINGGMGMGVRDGHRAAAPARRQAPGTQASKAWHVKWPTPIQLKRDREPNSKRGQGQHQDGTGDEIGRKVILGPKLKPRSKQAGESEVKSGVGPGSRS
ncbi:hypothetical protein EVAR_76201_1 [Eumeta japonica]|uniref:Uncharacterized protein n=1 Tax=Eumeta variegata TaxID=151549 RepID=A0A4C1UPG8_EUMVA|nr:hypothetical protein EVAR_76201_1 [Eumeta japonica]